MEMKKKYYLQIEIRYSVTFEVFEIDDETFKTNHYNKFMHSDLFDTEKECIDYGNKIIEDNLWIEQFPGYVGSRLERRLGYPLVAPRLKNGAYIFISVKSMNVMDSEDMSKELKKFDVKLIKDKVD